MVTNSFYENQVDNVVLISLEKAKQHLRVDADFADEDDLIEDYVKVATAAAQDYMSRSIFQRDFILEADSFNEIEFSANGSDDEVTKIEYYPFGETEKQELPATAYKIRKGTTVDTWLLKFLEKPQLAKRDDAVIITVKQGWVADAQTVSKVPMPIIQAVLLLLTQFYEIRENRGEVNATAAHALLRPYRKW